MEIQELQSLFARSPRVKALGRMLVDNSPGNITLSGLCASSAPMVFSAVGSACPQAFSKPFLFILDDEEQAGYFYNDLNQILTGGNTQDNFNTNAVCFLPSSFRRAVKYGQRDAANEILRTDTLTRLSTGRTPLLAVTYPSAMTELVVSRQQLNTNTLPLSKGQNIDIRDVHKKLFDLGFRRTDYVYEPGQFALRGSLIDVYSFSCEHPYRIDFFGDEIDSLRTFDVENQLSIDKLPEIQIVSQLTSSSEQCESLLTFLPQDTIIVTRDMTFLKQEIQRIWDEGFGMSAQISSTDENNSLDKLQTLCNPDTFNQQITNFKTILTGNYNQPNIQSYTDAKPNLKFNVSPQPVFHKNFDLLTTELKKYQEEKYKIYILADSQKQTDRLESIFVDIKAGIRFIPVSRTLHSGFIDHDSKIVIFTDHQIFDRFHKYNLRSEKARRGKMALTLKEIQQFQLGDYVVHIDHGVGRFGGLISIPEGGQMVEKIRINYDGGGVIYVSIHSLHKISKYKGQEGTPPRINKLGTGAWERLKERTKTKIKDIARDLIKLYSRRRTQKGYAFSLDTYLQTELEASFLYEDTPDQSRATQDVKNDMQNVRPMDRLICGDVGFGKTEVAIRAAFKAATDGKQVAVLVPTTVLAYQHYHTFTNRLKDMPVRIDYLSRARTPQQTKALLQDLADGKIDILIGTHRLTGKTVQWHDLGLLIIDEEQKFGVSTKEKIRQMKTNIDTLTLTATPIPRTLQFSLMGARDLSIIQTPPPNRYPIYTQLCTFSGEILAQAINFEMSRNGQTFIVCNRIATLPEIEQTVHRYVPDARIAVGHGQMPPEKLENIILGFANYDYDVLISTTIIESGIDMPNANTIIVCQAHNFGLSDLHQMRGRVGRSNRKAFCYLLSPPLSSLSQDARRRLQAIETFSDLGSGIHIAMQDLDIRGAGNLLGAEQSGFISDLGYETYQKILSEAVRELRNDEFQDLFREKIQEGTLDSGSEFVDECQLDTDLTAHLPETYVPTSSERMLLYRELDQMETPQQIQDFQKRLCDRFGKMPQEAIDLCGMIRLRQLGKESGVERLILKQGQMRLVFVSQTSSAFYQSPVFDRIISFFTVNSARCQLREKNGQRSMVVNDINTVSDALHILETINS